LQAREVFEPCPGRQDFAEAFGVDWLRLDELALDNSDAAFLAVFHDDGIDLFVILAVGYRSPRFMHVEQKDTMQIPGDKALAVVREVVPEEAVARDLGRDSLEHTAALVLPPNEELGCGPRSVENNPGTPGGQAKTGASWGRVREPAAKKRLLHGVGRSCPKGVCAMQCNETKLEKLKDLRRGIRCNRG
jgi:hypothetical protein